MCGRAPRLEGSAGADCANAQTPGRGPACVSGGMRSCCLNQKDGGAEVCCGW